MLQLQEIQQDHILIMIGVLLALIFGGIAIIRHTVNKDLCKHENIKRLAYEPNCFIVVQCKDCGEKIFTDLQDK